MNSNNPIGNEPASEAPVRLERVVSLSQGEMLMLYRAMKARAYDLREMYHTLDDAKLRESIWNEMQRMEGRASEIQAQANESSSPTAGGGSGGAQPKETK